MNYNYYTKRNPLSREQLFKFLLDKQLTDIRYVLWNSLNKEESKELSPRGNSPLFILDFNDAIKVAVEVGSYNLIEVKEIQKQIHVCAISKDFSEKFPGYYLYNDNNSFEVSIKNINSEIAKLLGQSIIDYYLIKETGFFVQK